MMPDSPYISRLKSRLRHLQERFSAILKASRLERYTRQSHPMASVFSDSPQAPKIELRWGKLSPELEREQNQIIKDFEIWHSDFIELFSNATQDENSRLNGLYLEMDSWLKYRRYRGVPDSVNSAMTLFSATCDKFISFLDQLPSQSETDFIFVVDTSVIIDCPDISLISNSLNISDAVFVVPSTTLSELDDLKTGKRNENFRRRLTAAIKHLSEITAMGDVLSGIELTDGIFVRMLATEPNFSNLPSWLDQSINDDRIVASAIELQRNNPKSTVTILANDINMQNKASLAGLLVKKVPIQDEDAG